MRECRELMRSRRFGLEDRPNPELSHFEFQRQAAQQMHKCDAFTALAIGRGTVEES